ncbi:MULTISPECIES: TetR/AcrR family transcriptional regulator [unclassified Pseudomonas]|uniref:TetR/AcrR family transcriptional regulator n=1 Tax=unclassified Pseudomonas TaxID=196821 RepID=UPI002580EBDF|nr:MULTISPECIES: TetR/AcrR family transcriptional regulator [unclassified Pseudomonas]
MNDNQGPVPKPTQQPVAGSTAADAAAPRKPRVNEKARQRTRSKLLRAARSVMGRKGIEATAINDITEEAELSFGSFYNYFSSKEEVARAVFIEDALLMIEALDAATSPRAGIAERVGINIRHTLHRGLTDPVWGWFLVHSVYSINDMIETMGNPLARDIQIGNDEGVFQVVDIAATVDCIVGGMLYLLRKVLEGTRPLSAVESMVQFVLSGLGVDPAEAQRIVRIDLSSNGAQPAAS